VDVFFWDTVYMYTMAAHYSVRNSLCVHDDVGYQALHWYTW